VYLALLNSFIGAGFIRYWVWIKLAISNKKWHQ